MAPAEVTPSQSRWGLVNLSFRGLSGGSRRAGQGRPPVPAAGAEIFERGLCFMTGMRSFLWAVVWVKKQQGPALHPPVALRACALTRSSKQGGLFEGAWPLPERNTNYARTTPRVTTHTFRRWPNAAARGAGIGLPVLRATLRGALIRRARAPPLILEPGALPSAAAGVGDAFHCRPDGPP